MTKSTRATKSPARAKAGASTRKKPTAHERKFLISSKDMPGWREARASLERFMLAETLAKTSGNMAAAARLLGITKVAVLHAVRRHDLELLTNSGGAY